VLENAKKAPRTQENPVILRPRKLLAAAAPLTLAALVGCGTTAGPAARAVAIPATITAPAPAPATAPVALVPSEGAPAPEAKAAPEPVLAATPLCDSNGRPLSGNVRRKRDPEPCTAAQLAAAAATPVPE